MFPDIVGLTKRGTSTSITTNEVDGQTVVSQVVTQTYMSSQPGMFRLLPFSISVNGITVRSEGAVLVVRAASPPSSGTIGASASFKMPTESGAAFLSLRTDKNSVFVGEGFRLRLSLFVSDAYPFELRFDGVDVQLQAVLKQLRPTNAWEEDAGIRQLKGQPVVINGRPFTEYVIFHKTYFPLSGGIISLPSVGLNIVRVRQNVRSAEANVAEATERIPFLTRPLTIIARPLPPHPLREQVAVGHYRLIERIDRTTVAAGKSIPYTVRIEGVGNIAALQPPLLSRLTAVTAIESTSPVTPAGLDALPAGSSQQINRTGDEVTGYKLFHYFLVPRREGQVALANVFGFVFFNTQTARYDTLLPRVVLRVGEGRQPTALGTGEVPQANASDALYAGLNEQDSTRQPVNLVVLTRAIANVLLVLMILGMIFVFLRK